METNPFRTSRSDTGRLGTHRFGIDRFDTGRVEMEGRVLLWLPCTSQQRKLSLLSSSHTEEDMRPLALLLVTLFSVMVSFPMVSLNSEELLKTCETSLGDALIYGTKILFADRSGKTTDSYITSPFEIKDCDVDEATGEMFLVLGKPGTPRGERLAVFSCTGGRIRQVRIDKDRGQNPWKIRVRDIDEDSKPDICVGVWKKSRFHPVMENRFYVYGWNGERIFPKWFGSRLSSPFVDFDFCDVDGDGFVELVALELQRNGLKRVMCYEWNGFGFEGVTVVGRDLEEKSLPRFNLGKTGGGK